MIRIPDAPKSIQKGLPLKNVLGKKAVHCLANNISYVLPEFRNKEFQKEVLNNLDSLEFMEKGKWDEYENAYNYSISCHWREYRK